MTQRLNRPLRATKIQQPFRFYPRLNMSDERVEMVRKHITSPMTQQQIADEHGVSVHLVRALCRQPQFRVAAMKRAA